MKHAEKNRDPELARKRAKSDARCALRKLGLLPRLARTVHDVDETDEPHVYHEACTSLVEALAEVLDVTPEDITDGE